MSFGNPLVQFGVRAVAAFAFLCTATLVASAQDAATPAAPGSPSPPWQKVCNTDPTTKAETCVVNQELRAETGQPVATVTIQESATAGKYGVGAVLPIGFILPPGVTFVVDGQKKGTAQFVICLPPSNRQPSVCLAQVELGDDFIASLKKGNKLALVVVTAQNKQIPIEMSLSGFSKTFDGPGIDRAAAESQRQQLSDALQKSAEEARKKLIEQQQKEMQAAPQ